MGKQDSFRGYGIDQNFVDKFKASDFYKEIYVKHKDNIIIGVRDGYINLYYNCDSIAKISCNTRSLKGEISPYYINNERGNRKNISESEIVQYYEDIKRRSDDRKKLEKQAQARLFIENNNNPNSEWFCIDIEYAKTGQHGRFDIIALSKRSPHKVALIELKYGNHALGGDSGIREHIKDFYTFFTGVDSFNNLKSELVSIIGKLEKLGVDLPVSLQGLEEEGIAPIPLFYIIVLNNNIELGKNSTPKQTISGYLFKDKRWGCKRISTLIKKRGEGDYFELINNDKSFPLTFLFSKSTLPNSNSGNIGISDILNEKFYDKEIISF